MGRKRAGRYLGHPSPEEVDRVRLMWRKNLERHPKRKEKPSRRVSRQRKMSKKETEEESEVINTMSCSEVFLETPTGVDGRLKIMNLNPDNFWDFVYQEK